jgi:PAS domain S-box-containing protein
MIARPFSEFTHPTRSRTATTFSIAHGHSAAHPLSASCAHAGADGGWRDCEPVVRAQADLAGEPGIVVNMRDITDRKHAARTQALLASIVANSDDAIVSLEPDATPTSWNAGAERLFGYRADEVIRRRQDFLRLPDETGAIDDHVKKFAAGGGTERYETQRLSREGRVIDVAVTLSPFRDEPGALTGVASIARDVSADKRRRNWSGPAMRHSNRHASSRPFWPI